mgnify:CR=1 FL=1
MGISIIICLLGCHYRSLYMVPETAFQDKPERGQSMFTAENSGGHKRTIRNVSKPSNPYQEKSYERTQWFLDPGAILLAAGIITAFVLVILSFVFPAAAASAMLPQDDSSITPSQGREGSLRFKDVRSGQ